MSAFTETTYLDHWEIRDADAEVGAILATFPGAEEKAARKAFEALKGRNGTSSLHLIRRYGVVWQDGSR